MSVTNPLNKVFAALIEQDVAEACEHMKNDPIDTSILRGLSRAELCVAMAEQSLIEVLKVAVDPTAELTDALRPIAGGLLTTLNHYDKENAAAH